MSKKLTAILAVAAFAAAPLLAGSNSASLSVSAEVVARTLLGIDSQPAALDVTANDIARGYIDLPQSVAFHIRTNASNGYRLEFEPVQYPFSEARVSWSSNLAVVAGEGSWVARPYRGGLIARTMSVRVMLAPGTQPGTYAWPVHFSASSL